jgi:hypothetical protein
MIAEVFHVKQFDYVTQQSHYYHYGPCCLRWTQSDKDKQIMRIGSSLSLQDYA